jgi:HAD superfamily phosphoserine phosphatase-like hydrolase
MLKGKVSTIILDVDETLSDEVSWYKLTNGLGASSNRHAVIFEKFTKGELSYRDAKERLIKLWQSTGKANKEYMKGMFHSWKLRKGARKIVDYLRNKYRLCLISGAVDLYVQIVSEKLEITDWYANTELVWDKQDKLVDFHYFEDQAQKKLEQFKEYIKLNKIDRDRCAVVGNGDSDLALFKHLKYGIEVNSTPSLVLQGLSFKTVDKLEKLKDIF